MVSRVVIQWLSLVFLIQLSFLLNLFHHYDRHISHCVIRELKCAATGFSVFHSLTSEGWQLIRSCSACSVSPTYCWPHLSHWMTYTTLVDLHVAGVLTLWVVPVLWFMMVSVVSSMGQVLQPRPPHGLVPGCCFFLGVTSALTSRSRRFLGLR